jgi:hypothetical protein
MADYPEQQADFSALRRAATPQDTSLTAPITPLVESVNKPPDPIVVQAGLVRSVAAAGDLSVGIVPTNTGLCIVAVESDEVSGACNAMPYIRGDGLTLGFRDGQGYQLVGALPDGSTSAYVIEQGGYRIPATLSANNGFIVTTTAAPEAFIYSDATGVIHRSALPGGAS